jgi:hypothetical protein
MAGETSSGYGTARGKRAMIEMPLGNDPDERAFSNLLRPGIRELHERRGPCPSSEDLVAFRESRLPLEEAARVRDHVESCGLCDAQLGRLEAADRPPWRSVWALVRQPALAYGLVALLLLPAYRGLIQPAGNVGIVPVPSFSLDVVRSNSQTQQSPVVRLAGNERFFLLSFFIPLKASPPHRYEVVVVQGDQTALVSAQPLRNCDVVGNCLLLCDAALFASGRYEVRVQETPPDGSMVVHPFPFEFTR